MDGRYTDNILWIPASGPKAILLAAVVLPWLLVVTASSTRLNHRRILDTSIKVKLMRWEQAETASSAIRRTVFQEEQGIPAAADFDGRDPACLHLVAFVQDLVAFVQDQPAGVARSQFGADLPPAGIRDLR